MKAFRMRETVDRLPASEAIGGVAVADSSNVLAVRWALAVMVLALLWSTVAAIFLPLIQDDGWNAAIVLSKIRQGDPFAETPVPGFVTNAYRAYYSVAYHGLQEVFARVFGDSYFVFRLNTIAGGTVATVAIYFIVLRLTSSIAAGVFASLIFCFHPLFFVHANNRNEMFALGVVLTSLALLVDAGLSPRAVPGRAAAAFFLPFVAFDVHPISVMLVVGYGSYLFVTRRDVILPALAGAAAGALYLVFSKTRVSGDFSSLAALIGLNAKASGSELIDHYVPLFNFRLDVAVLREKVRLAPFVKIGLVSGLWIILIVRFRELVRQKAFRILGIAILSMWIFSVLFFDQAGNGYFLYVWAAFMIAAGYLAFEAARLLERRFAPRWVWLVLALPFSLLIARGALLFYVQPIRHYRAYRAAYERIPASLALRPGEVIAARPTFWFLFYKSPNRLVNQFLATLVMKQNKVGFIEAYRQLGATVIGLDDSELRTFWFADATGKEISLNPFYSQLPRITSAEFAGYIHAGVLRPIATFDDPTHGRTTFYRVDYTKAGSGVVAR